MSPAHENAIRSVARACRAEIINAIASKPKSEHDQITSILLDKHTKQITALPPGKFSARLWLTYYVRVVDKEMRT